MQEFETTLSDIKKLNDNTYLFRFKLKEGESIDFKAGQYVMMKIGDKSRLYSISSSPMDNKHFDMIIELIEGGLGSEYVKSLKIGDRVSFRGPIGFFVLKGLISPMCFVATGTGIAPIWSMLQTLPDNYPHKVKLIWGIRYKRDLYLENELKSIKNRIDNFEVKFCLSREEDDVIGSDNNYFKGRVTDYFKILDESMINNADFYICGGRLMTDDVRSKLLEMGIEKARIISEKF